MRVLFNLLDAHVGGGQEVALGVAGKLVARGHSVGVVVPETGPATVRFEALGGAIHRADLISLRKPAVIRGARIARAYDIVYSHTSAPGEILGGLAAALARRPHVIHRHVYPHFSRHRPVRALQHALYRAVVPRARIIAVAEHIADEMADVGIPRGLIEVIPNGVVVPAEAAPPRVGDGPVLVGLLARLDPQKGGDLFVAAAASIGGEAELVLGAPSARGAYAEGLLASAAAARVRVVMPAGPEFLREMDVVAMPSRYEGHPLTLLEAMALGKPVVATAIPGIREVVEPEETGLLVPVDDVDALAAALRRLVADADLRARLGARARVVVAARYMLEPVLERLEAFLEDVAATRAPS